MGTTNPQPNWYGYWICPACDAENRDQTVFPDDEAADKFGLPESRRNRFVKEVEKVRCHSCNREFKTAPVGTEDVSDGSVELIPAVRLQCEKCKEYDVHPMIVSQKTPDGKFLHADEERAKAFRRQVEKILSEAGVNVDALPEPCIMMLPRRIRCRHCGHISETD